jgi:hypothetical protein
LIDSLDILGSCFDRTHSKYSYVCWLSACLLVLASSHRRYSDWPNELLEQRIPSASLESTSKSAGEYHFPLPNCFALLDAMPPENLLFSTCRLLSIDSNSTAKSEKAEDAYNHSAMSQSKSKSNY